MRRVVFCLNGPNATNGPNVWLTRHLPLLKERDVEPLVLYLTWAAGEPCRYKEMLERGGIPVVPLRLGRFIEKNAATVADAAAALQPDAFVPNYSVAGYYAARFLKNAGVTTVGTLHSDDPYYHDIIDVFVAGPEPWRLSGVVSVSAYLRDLVSQRAPAIASLHAPYGAPVPADCARWTPGRLRMVYSGRLVEPQKRVHRVARAMTCAALALPEVDGVLYGEGPERPHLDAVLAPASGRVRVEGLLNPSGVQRALLDAQVFVLLSDFEGLSIALMEAMACGVVPIVTPMRSGVADLVEDGITGFVVPADDDLAFREVVTRLASDRELWQRVSSAARRAVVAGGLTTGKCADRWSEFLHSLGPRRGGPQALHIPPTEEWDLPPRSVRVGGIGVEDRRSAWPSVLAAMDTGRPVFLWGAGSAGEAFLASLPRRDCINGVVDSDPCRHGRTVCGVPILCPEALLSPLGGSRRPFVVITSQYEPEIATALAQMGLYEHVDFVAG